MLYLFKMNFSSNFSITLLAEAAKKAETLTITQSLIIYGSTFVVSAIVAVVFYILHFRHIDKMNDKEFAKRKTNPEKLKKDKAGIFYTFVRYYYLILGFGFLFAAVGLLVTFIYVLTKL